MRLLAYLAGTVERLPPAEDLFAPIDATEVGRSTTHLDVVLLAELEQAGKLRGADLESTPEATRHLVSVFEGQSENWLASARGRGLISPVGPEGDSALTTEWALTDRGRQYLGTLHDRQKLLPRAAVDGLAKAALDGIFLAIKTLVAGLPVLLVAWWWGIIEVSTWPVVAVTVAVASGLVAALFGRRRYVRQRPMRGQAEWLHTENDNWHLRALVAQAVVEQQGRDIEAFQREDEARQRESEALDARLEASRSSQQGSSPTG